MPVLYFPISDILILVTIHLETINNSNRNKLFHNAFYLLVFKFICKGEK